MERVEQHPITITLYRPESDVSPDSERDIEAGLRSIPGVLEAHVYDDRTAITLTCAAGTDLQLVHSRSRLYGFLP